jgi:hypothetical protein
LTDKENATTLCVRVSTASRTNIFSKYLFFFGNVSDDIQGQNSFKCEKFMKKNKTHIRITDHVFKFKPKRVVLDYDNIIAGNKQLSEEVRKTLNENSLAIYSDFGPALEKVMASVWMQNVNRVFSRVPEDELFLP